MNNPYGTFPLVWGIEFQLDFFKYNFHYISLIEKLSVV